MQTIEIHTQSGQKYKVQTDAYDANAINVQLNNNDLITICIDKHIIQRIDVKRIIPIDAPIVEGSIKLEVHTNSGIYYIITNDYDANFINEQLNKSSTITVEIAGYIFSRIDIKQIIPMKEEPTEPETPPVTLPGETGEGGTTTEPTTPPTEGEETPETETPTENPEETIEQQ